ncbi:SDR family oxidoreductase [Streptomyces sp. NPDC048281]|uniref:SDR family NAD(P)-dependent oxidoreductase n=1 Tax=Streptomyces sp. NPDC048281 TaxID=3154715 RepID=UPI003417575E
MSGRLDGRAAIVTGAAGGIGGGAARRFADEGALLALSDIDGPAVEAVAQEIRDKGGRAIAVQCDIAVPEQIEAVVDATIREYGTVDILANIAQGGLDEHHLLEDATPAEGLTAYRTGPLQSMIFMQKCLPYMKERRYGRVINTASGAAVSPRPGFATNTFLPVGQSDAFNLTEQGRAAAAQIEAHSPLRRFGTPYDDVAPLLVFLASEEAGYINGQAIGADGGITFIA